MRWSSVIKMARSTNRAVIKCHLYRVDLIVPYKQRFMARHTAVIFSNALKSNNGHKIYSCFINCYMPINVVCFLFTNCIVSLFKNRTIETDCFVDDMGSIART